MIKSVDIIIPVYLPGEDLRSLVCMLEKQTMPYSRLIVVNTLPEGRDNGGEVGALLKDCLADGSRLLLKHIEKKDFDHGGTRRFAAGLSGAEVFICMTQDAVPADERLIETLLKALDADEKLASAYARQLPVKDAGPIERFTRGYNYPASSRVKSLENLGELGIKTYFSSNVCCAYRKSIYLDCGGFAKRAIFNEDMVFACHALRKGYRIRYEAGAKVYHSHDYGLVMDFKRNFDNGMSQAMNKSVFGGISSEKEGLGLVRESAEYLINNGRARLVPKLVLHSAAKYLGYRLGKSYERLPESAVLGLCMNRDFVKRMYGEEHLKGKYNK